MTYTNQEITLKLGKDKPEGEMVVGAQCRMGLACHPATGQKTRWTVTHIATGRKITWGDEGLASEAAAKAYLSFCLMFDIDWTDQLVNQVTNGEESVRPLKGSALASFRKKAKKWKPPAEPKAKAKVEPKAKVKPKAKAKPKVKPKPVSGGVSLFDLLDDT